MRISTDDARLGRYRVDQTLSADSLGTLYVAQDSGDGEPVLLFRLSTGMAPAQEFQRAAALHAAELTAFQGHGLLPLREAVADGSTCVLSWPCPGGASLATVAAQDGLSPEAAAAI